MTGKDIKKDARKEARKKEPSDDIGKERREEKNLFPSRHLTNDITCPGDAQWTLSAPGVSGKSSDPPVCVCVCVHVYTIL